jgi:hypothetical protein
MTYVLEAEKSCAGAGSDLLLLVAGRSPSEVRPSYDREGLLDVISQDCRLTKRERQLLETACDMSTTSGRISIKRSRDTQCFIEKTEGYAFEVTPLTPGSRELPSPTVVCIDGFVEEVSEIHHLLQGLSETRRPCVVFLRGMSDDVLNTIRVNNDRGSISLYPVRVPYELDSVNTLVDIAVVAGTDVVSSLKGDLISSIRVEDLVGVDSVSLHPGRVVLKNRSTKGNVEIHVREMKKKIEERPEVESVLAKRLRSLSSSHVDIYLPGDMCFEASSGRLDRAIRHLNSHLSGGAPRTTVARSFYDTFHSTLREIGEIVC